MHQMPLHSGASRVENRTRRNGYEVSETQSNLSTGDASKINDKLLNVALSAHLCIGEFVPKLPKRERVISYAVMAALELAISEAGGELVGMSMELVATKDKSALDLVQDLLDEQRKAKQ